MVPMTLGLLAGMITTLSGMGGGMVLVLALALWWDPLTALATTAPALLFGNLHRLGLYRTHLPERVAVAYAAGCLPGAVLGGGLATAVPPELLRIAMLSMATLALVRPLLRWQLPSAWWLYSTAGLGVGFVAATGGGAGLLAGPFLLATGLSGRTYVATAALGSVAVHLGRLGAYGLGGAVHTETVLWGGALALAISGGNLIGDRLRSALDQRWMPRLEGTVVLVCVGLGIVGAA